ncbi:hypothetical protein [Photobacterium leiognathi]|uniref:hypothetical protein n=1 Tax=Photobacterium leiognathi TaxID=553611 RepID=UPI0027398688|nr:hypothetical protein [Photobacterium leiognathi]
MSTIVDLDVFSPRWGRNDVYSVELRQDCMTISMSVRKATAKWVENCDPEWSGENIQRIMNNDGIYPPEIIQDLFERAWKAWRNGDLSDQQVDNELKLIADWINVVTKHKPDSAFWNKYF